MELATLIIAGIAAVATLFALIFTAVSQKKQNEVIFRNSELIKDDLKNTIGHTMRDENSALQRDLNSRFDSVQQTMTHTVSDNMQTANQITSATLKRSADLTEARLKEFSERIDRLNETTENRLLAIQKENSEKLEKMQQTVNEKLETSLKQRVSESFELVSNRLKEVSEGLNEMQNIAGNVKDLKQVLSNVKTRGVFGEIQLSRILEQILTRNQYAENVITVPETENRVEFAIKLPGKGEIPQVWLPIDSKFPMDRYEAVLSARETGNKEQIDNTLGALQAAMKKNAKDICEKYIRVPYTTEYGILFLPTEGLYAETVQIEGLIESLMEQYHISVAGPSTLAALLNSLQMGFKTLAIEQKASEVWQVLGEVKTEFGKFEGALNKVQERMDQANKELSVLRTTRTNVMMRKLKNVEEAELGEAENE